MTKQLREWTAPDGGETYRWDPTVNYVQRKVGETWVCVFDATEILDHADALNALRADPYVPAPKELRGIVLDVVDRAYAAGNRGPSYGPWLGITEETDALLALIDRERPALGEVDGEVLVAEMEKRGWKVREVGYSSHGDIYHSTEGEDPRTAYGINRVRRVLIAPERAG